MLPPALFCKFFFNTVSTLAQEKISRNTERKIDQLVEQRLPDIAPGAVVLLASGDRIIYHKAFGYENAAAKIKMEKDAVFRIGSLTKPFTALAILLLAQEGKIRLQDRKFWQKAKR